MDNSLKFWDIDLKKHCAMLKNKKLFQKVTFELDYNKKGEIIEVKNIKVLDEDFTYIEDVNFRYVDRLPNEIKSIGVKYA